MSQRKPAVIDHSPGRKGGGSPLPSSPEGTIEAPFGTGPVLVKRQSRAGSPPVVPISPAANDQRAAAELTDRELMLRCAEEPRSEPAWAEFVARFDRFAHGQALRAVRKLDSSLNHRGVDNLVRELVQEFYLRLISDNGKALRAFRQSHQHSAYAYFTIIISRLASDWFRQQRTQSRRGQEISIDHPRKTEEPDEAFPQLELQDPGAGPDRIAGGREDLQWVVRLISARSKPKFRDRNLLIFRLAFIGELSSEEISRCEGLKASPGLVRAIIRDIKQMVQQELARQAEQSKRGASRIARTPGCQLER